jgi:hypothetical protein
MALGSVLESLLSRPYIDRPGMQRMEMEVVFARIARGWTFSLVKQGS